MDEFLKGQVGRLTLLECLGIKFEDVQNKICSENMTCTYEYFFSIPETSVLEMDGFGEEIRTQKGLKQIAKTQVMEMLSDAFDVSMTDPAYNKDEYMKDVVESCKVLVRVREGEEWDDHKAEEAVRLFAEALKNPDTYEEI